MPKKIQIAPSILSADFGKLNAEIAAIESVSDRLHVDVMDGHFVPNITMGPPVVKKIRTKLPIDCHLMIEHPEKYLEDFKKSGASTIIIHIEAKGNALKTLKKIKKLKMSAGICIKPKTSEKKLTKNIMKFVDIILIMTVEPGFGGQGFMPKMLTKIKNLRKTYPKMDIMVDGGINAETAKQCIQAGANILVAGNYVYSSKNYKKAIESLRK
jgi:ribulose-phosphate 3-epimerase